MRKILLVMLIALLAVPVLAHDPYLEDDDFGGFEDPVEIPVFEISYAYYSYLENEDDIDVYAITFENEGDLFRSDLLVPVCGEHYANFYPHYVVLAPNYEAEQDYDLPFDIPADYGVYFYPTPEITEERGTHIEPFGDTELYDSPVYDLNVPSAGTYYIVVFHPEGETGDYIMVTGYEERFENSIGETLRKTGIIRSDTWLHRDCDAPVPTEVAPAYAADMSFLYLPIAIASMFIVGLIFAGMTIRNRNRRRNRTIIG